MGKIIEVSKLTKIFGDFTAVDGVSFDIEKGEIFGLLGPNGAGKTTIINMLIGMNKISSGSIRYNGEDLTKNIKKAQGIIGVVADESNLYAEMSGYENLCFCGALYDMPKSERQEKANKMLEIFKLKEAADKKFQFYSKGMKRKLTIAAALMHNPKILFLDEPTTGIDVMSARQIRELIKELNKNGTTIFLTTHYIEEAERLCDRIGFINKSKIVNIDSVSNILRKTKAVNVIEVFFEPTSVNKDELAKGLKQNFSGFDCIFKNSDCLKIISPTKIDISPVVAFLSSKNIFITEAKLINPTLEDAFIKMTGIGMEMMKKEKEKNK
ncbi:MAG: ABC transporter [Firmicutes bacterium ML8_F2]|jgi:ABC-2 type transport system ATP-binding protein|nr:MAG: ABC transporter [Firmicutes bacterium ML8_F2]